MVPALARPAVEIVLVTLLMIKVLLILDLMGVSLLGIIKGLAKPIFKFVWIEELSMPLGNYSSPLPLSLISQLWPLMITDPYFLILSCPTLLVLNRSGLRKCG